jgi:hypothetical protein
MRIWYSGELANGLADSAMRKGKVGSRTLGASGSPESILSMFDDIAFTDECLAAGQKTEV